MPVSTCGCCGKPVSNCTCWEFPGWGKVRNVADLEPEAADKAIPAKRLGAWRATAICGNDITSSCLYVSALAALYAGPLAPLALALVAGVLYLFRGIYAEVGSALPLNGGAYNVLLNTTTKARAAIAACLVLLSYLATAVISAGEAMSYASELVPALDVFSATVALLGVFAILNLLGISDSANVALAIFVFHLLTLSVLVLLSLGTVIADPSLMLANWNMPLHQWPTPRSGGVMVALFFGFSAAMLGISGFESSANYIEEQRPGVFPKTLRNMWIAVAIFNPLISFLSLGVLPMNKIEMHKEALLSKMGQHSVIRLGNGTEGFLSNFISAWISLDAVVVLSGAVLTSYVGVTGLMRRMSLDLCLPQFLLRRNRWRGTNHWIIGVFFALCCSILLITQGKIEMLAGVYTLSFLSVMGLFALGNLLLKRKHPQLPRASKVSPPTAIVAIGAVAAALLGNVLIDPAYVRVFAIYFVGAVVVVGLMFFRSMLLTNLLRMGQFFLGSSPFRGTRLRNVIATLLQQVQCRAVLYVASEGSVDELRTVAKYVRRNEQIRILKIVWCYDQPSEVSADLPKNRHKIDQEFPTVHVDLLLVQGRPCPQLLAALSERLDVPGNYIFINAKLAATIDDFANWGGVRIIA